MTAEGQPSFSSLSSMSDPTMYPAYAGYSGFVVYKATGTATGNYLLRADRCSLKGTQEIDSIKDIDGSIDSTRYALKPFSVSGDISFNLDSSPDSAGYLAFERIYQDVVLRSRDGRLLIREQPGCRNMLVRYGGDVAYEYLDIVPNKMDIECSANEALRITTSFIGRGRRGPFTGTSAEMGSGLSDASGGTNSAPIRVVTYNDISISIVQSSGNGVNTIMGVDVLPLVKSFTMSIDNQVEAVHTLSGTLAAYDLIAKKRQISGSITFLGRNKDVADYAMNHEIYSSSKVGLKIKVRFGNTTRTLLTLRGVIFKIESMDLTNDVLNSTMSFIALGDQSIGYEAITGLNSDAGANSGAGHPYPFI